MKKISLALFFLAPLFVNAQQKEPTVVLLPSEGKTNQAGTALLDSAQQGLQNMEKSTLQTAQGIMSTGSVNNNKSNTLQPWSGYHAAESMATNGSPELALKQLEARLVSEPNDAKATYLKGLILMQLGKGEDAERWFKMMRSNFPDLPQPYNALAVIYSGRDDLRSAQVELETLLEKSPKHYSARINLANIHLKMAVENYEQALKNKPTDQKTANILNTLNTLK